MADAVEFESGSAGSCGTGEHGCHRHLASGRARADEPVGNGTAAVRVPGSQRGMDSGNAVRGSIYRGTTTARCVLGFVTLAEPIPANSLARMGRRLAGLISLNDKRLRKTTD